MSLSEYAHARELLLFAIEVASHTSHWRLRTEALLALADLELANGTASDAWSLFDEANEVRGSRLYPLSDMGRFERLHRHYLWSTHGFEQVAKHAAAVSLRQRCIQLADRLEVEAFHQWILWREGYQREEAGSAMNKLKEMGLW